MSAGDPGKSAHGGTAAPGSARQHPGTVSVAARQVMDRLWEVSDDLLGTSNFAGYFSTVNPTWTKLLGWSEDELRTMHVSELWHPEDAEHSRAACLRLAEGVRTVRTENRFRHKDGSWRWINWAMTAEDGLIYLIGRHVTAEKQTLEALRDSERQFRLLVAGVTDYALYMLSPDGIVSSWNSGAQRIKGYAQSEIIGQHFSRFYTEAERAAGVPIHALAVARRTGTYQAEGWRVRKDGSLFWANVVIDAIHDETGTLIGFAKITRDVTERREAQLALQRTEEQLMQSQKMEALGQLTGGIAHDFNNMLMVVSGHTQSLKQRLSAPRDLRALDAIELAAVRGESLTRQLLAFSRRQSLNPKCIKLDQRINAIRDLLLSSAPGNIELKIEIPADIWPVAVDPSEFELALVNVVVNARDAMTDGGTITIAAENLQLEAADTPDGLHGSFVALKVSDTGTGIDPEVLPKVFEPFFTTKQVGKGTGLGLSQVYGFSRQSGGTTMISSQVGRGSTVTIYLPLSILPIDDDAGLPAAEEPGYGNETILLAEDNAEVAAIAASLLEQLGYRTRRVESAPAVLELLASGAPVDLVLSDVVMPGEFDGLTLANLMKEEFPKIPVLLTSGYAKALAAAERGFPILRKPYKLATLGRAVRHAIDQSRTTKSLI
jgi:PAS domain S-box-containing protein